MTFDEIYTQIKTDWCNRLNISVDNAGYNVIVMSKVFAGGAYLLVKMIDNIKNNVWVGSMQAAKLLEVGQDKIGRGLYLATKGEYLCSTIAKGVGDIDEGTIFTFTIDGNIHTYETTTTVSGGSNVTIRALNSGSDSKLEIGDVPTSQKALVFAESEITVLSISEEPTDTETIEDYRAVVVAFERLRLGNGNASDYILWISNVNGLRTGYVYTAENEAGKGVFYCESTDSEVLVPSSALIDDAIDSIKYDSNGKSQPPVEFFEFINSTYVLPVKITGVKLEVSGGDAGQLSDIQSIIRSYLLTKRPFLHTVNKIIKTSDGLNSLENTISLVDVIQLLANSSITFTGISMSIDVLSSTVYSTKDVYVVGYRGGSVYPSIPSPSNDPALPLYYGECPRLEDVTFI